MARPRRPFSITALTRSIGPRTVAAGEDGGLVEQLGELLRAFGEAARIGGVQQQLVEHDALGDAALHPAEHIAAALGLGAFPGAVALLGVEVEAPRRATAPGK